MPLQQFQHITEAEPGGDKIDAKDPFLLKTRSELLEGDELQAVSCRRSMSKMATKLSLQSTVKLSSGFEMPLLGFGVRMACILNFVSFSDTDLLLGLSAVRFIQVEPQLQK